MMFHFMQNKKAFRSSIQLGGMSILSFVIGFLMSYDAANMRDESISGSHHGMKEKHISQDDELLTSPLTTLELLGTISMKQKQLYNEILPPEYGRFSEIFNVDNLERIFQVTPLSKRRMTRILMIKILLRRIRSSKKTYPSDVGEPIFRWATTGDSAAAGHGNAFTQSYTAVLLDTVEGVFRSAGIDFVATNHAGDAYSGTEMALCLESIVGRDVDVISWDFMQHHHVNARGNGDRFNFDPLLFGERAGRVLPHLPFLFYLGILSDHGLERLETSGLGIGILGGETIRELILTFPNYNDQRGRNAPLAVNKFHCDGTIEGREVCDDPSQLHWCNSEGGKECAAAKYNAGKECNNERYQTSSNDGWKMHRLKGRLLGFHLIEMLRVAAIQLDMLEREQSQLSTNPLDLFAVLRSEEEVEEFLFTKTRPSRHVNEGSSVLESWTQMSSKCHSAKDSLSKLQTSSLHQFEFDPPKETLCDDLLHFQNIYIRIRKEDGWVSINPVGEMNTILTENETSMALALCFKNCYENQCHDNIDLDKIEVEIGGNARSKLVPIDGPCYIVQGQGVLGRSDGMKEASSVMRVRNHGDVNLLFSSISVLY